MYHATRACLSSVNPRRVYCTVPFAAGYWSDSFTEGAGAKKQKQMPLDMKSPTGIQFRKIYSICGKKIFVQFRNIYSICGEKNLCTVPKDLQYLREKNLFTVPKDLSADSAVPLHLQRIY